MSRPANQPAYPVGTVATLLDGNLVTPATREALRQRLAPIVPPAAPVLDGRQLAVLAAVATRLIPRAGPTAAIDLVAAYHRRLADGVGIGWRFADLPPATEAARRGLDAIAASDFVALTAEQQDEVLRAVQFGRAAGDAWRGLDQQRWFQDLLATLVDIYYSHPAAQDEIGYAGMADARGWQDVGFAARRPHEPEPLAAPRGASPE